MLTMFLFLSGVTCVEHHYKCYVSHNEIVYNKNLKLKTVYYFITDKDEPEAPKMKGKFVTGCVIWGGKTPIYVKESCEEIKSKERK